MVKEPLYGFRTQSHGWQYVLTVIAASGARSVAQLSLVTGLEVEAIDGHLTRFLEKRDGAIDTFVVQHNIIELDRSRWEQVKNRLGKSIY